MAITSDQEHIDSAYDIPANPFAQNTDTVLAALETNTRHGLDARTAQRRLEKFGLNTIGSQTRTSLLALVWSQFQSPIVWLLAAAALIAFVFGEHREAIAVALVLLINGAIGFVTELRAISSMEALQKLGETVSRVRRNGAITQIPSSQLVPGDMVLLEAGDIVSADIRLVEVSGLQIDESTLTGESVTIDKQSDPVDSDATLGDKFSMAFRGTSVTRGEALGVVVATGTESEVGRITELVSKAGSGKTPLEEQLADLSGQLIWLTLALAAAIAAVGMLSGRDTLLMIQAAIALAVAAIPEGLPIVATMALARGMWRMAEQNALVGRLSSVETLGATTVILTDKTGTLTENRMTAEDVWVPSGRQTLRPSERSAELPEDTRRVLEIGVFCNHAKLGEDGEAKSGDPIEIALLQAGRSHGIDRHALLKRCPEANHIPFETLTKMMATVHRGADAGFIAVKGAPETILNKSDRIVHSGTTQILDDKLCREWLAHVETMARSGLRVLGFAEKPTSESSASAESMNFVGLIGFRDPPRDDVPAAIRDCRNAGINVVMVTGDHLSTATAIAKTVGIGGRKIEAIESSEVGVISELSLPEREQLLAADVFSRVSPDQKLDLIALHQEAGDIVAMTGDGVNDAPALRQADIGIAMGQRGTQVAREAADIVLLDDAFPTIVKAIHEGRVIFDNIRNFVVYLLSCNLSEVLVVALAILLKLPLALLPLQILFLNLVTDVFPAFALGASEGGKGVLRRSPRNPGEKLIGRHHWMTIIKYGLTMTAATLTALTIALRGLHLPEGEAITISFLTLAFAQLFHVFNMRAPGSGLVNNEVTRNPYIWGALALCIGLLLLALYLPVLATALKVTPPSLQGWIVILSMAAIPLVVGQVSLSLGMSRQG